MSPGTVIAGALVVLGLFALVVGCAWAVAAVMTGVTRRRRVRGWIAYRRLDVDRRTFAWDLTSPAGGVQHMLPTGDARTHVEAATCPCQPRTEHLGGVTLVTHIRGRVAA